MPFGSGRRALAPSSRWPAQRDGVFRAIARLGTFADPRLTVSTEPGNAPPPASGLAGLMANEVDEVVEREVHVQ